MPKVIVAAQVKDSAVWEKNFGTHADVFRSMGVTKPVHYAVNPGNDVAVSPRRTIWIASWPA